MKTYPAPKPPRHVRVPAFVPVPSRQRADGWTVQRQAEFLVHLARTRSVAAAARGVGMARQSVYRLRSRTGAEGFARVWDLILGRGPDAGGKVTAEERMRRALEGVVVPRVWRGRLAGIERKPDGSALLSLLAQLDRAALSKDDGDGW